nr:hypothetical protein 1 [Moraxellaceae bacterium]
MFSPNCKGKNPSRPSGRGGFLLNADTGDMRDPKTVRLWIVKWVDRDGLAYALKGTFDLCADLAAAFSKGVKDGLLQEASLIPCTKDMPKGLYKLAHATWLDFKDERLVERWDNFLDEYGEAMPDVFTLMRLRQ